MPKMHGPGISNPEEIVEREVPQCDVQAYVAIGYKMGGLPKKVEAEAPEAPQPKTKAKPKK